IRLVPDAMPVIDLLKRHHGFHTPQGESESFTAVKEILEDILEYADTAGLSRDGDSVIVSVKGYRFYDGCRFVAGESPKICTMHPCGICSLSACILASGLSVPVKIDYIDMDDKTRSLRIIVTPGPVQLRISVTPGPAHQPTGADHGSSG
ncbi:MAG TPA: hypothetical protein P5263_10590, partial [Methanoregulaceae archaeon]|nr:hypothetical protein [Methanoregulaceae archaeon]